MPRLLKRAPSAAWLKIITWKAVLTAEQTSQASTLAKRKITLPDGKFSIRNRLVKRAGKYSN